MVAAEAGLPGAVKTKEEIVIAVAEAELARVEAVLDAAQAEPDPALAREVLLSRIVDLAIERRHLESMLASDPVLNRFFAGHEPFRQLMNRLYRMLLGEDSPEARLSGAMLTAAIGGAVMHPMTEGFDDAALRSQGRTRGSSARAGRRARRGRRRPGRCARPAATPTGRAL